MFKTKIPLIATPLCLTLSSTSACSKKTPKDAAEAYCMNLSSCSSEEESEKQCINGVESDIEYYADDYGKDCEKAVIDYYFCLSELSCAEMESDDTCPQEWNKVDHACS